MRNIGANIIFPMPASPAFAAIRLANNNGQNDDACALVYNQL